MSKEAMKLALEALKIVWEEEEEISAKAHQVVYKTIKALEEALAKQEQGEPVAVKRMREWIVALKSRSDNGEHMTIDSGISAGTCWELAVELEQFINTTPQQRTPLTDEEYSIMAEQYTGADGLDCVDFGRAISRHYGIKE